MPYVKVVEQPASDVAPLYDKLAASRGGKVPDLFRVLGHSAAMLSPAIAVADFVGMNSALSPKIKQIAYISASRYNKCEYCFERHLVAARKVGLTEEQELAFRDSRPLVESPAFDNAEKLVIQIAEELTANTQLAQTTLQSAKENFSEEQLVEIVFVTASANMFNRIANGLHVELEPA